MKSADGDQVGQSAAREAFAEYQSSLRVKADFPETQLAIAGTALALRQLNAAEKASIEATTMDRQRVDAWTLLVRVRAARGDTDGAIETAQAAFDLNPESAVLRDMLRDLQQSK